MSTEPSANSVVLTDDEVLSLAHFLAGRKLWDAVDWLDWEDVPLVDEATHQRIVDAIAARGRSMCTSADPPGGHDGAYLLGRVS